ncbi:DUF6221 family protein [Streptomyces longwoodensis]|uniref:DUF6221 family protein n=1 Tax=Streptomyces longwoodensis TaxID=68231 RepID=UPI00338DF926
MNGGQLLAWLDDAIAECERSARAAEATDPSPWSADLAEGTGLLVSAEGEPLWDCENSSALCMTAAASVHAALHDPASVLRRCAADRKLLMLHGGRGHGCPAYDCDGDLEGYARFYDHEVCPVVLGIAEGYGWQGTPGRNPGMV